jgi:2-dehydropantoate 2-reductase
MNVAVIGTGGVGGYFGGLLTQLLPVIDGLKIYFIARNRHLHEIRQSGLLLDTDRGEYICKPTMATSNIPELPELDLCLICVKSYSLDEVLAQLKPKINRSTLVLPLLNGVDIYERIRSVVHDGIVFPSCVYVGTYIERAGKVTQRGGASTIIFGKDPENPITPHLLFNMFDRAGIKYKWTGDPYTEIWSKFLFIASFGLVTANSGRTIGEVLGSNELTADVKGIMNEVVEIALKKHVPLPATIIEDTFTKAKSFPYETKTSFQRDYETADKADERDIFGGTIIRLGKQLGTRTAFTEKIYNSIQKSKPFSF